MNNDKLTGIVGLFSLKCKLFSVFWSHWIGGGIILNSLIIFDPIRYKISSVSLTFYWLGIITIIMALILGPRIKNKKLFFKRYKTEKQIRECFVEALFPSGLNRWNFFFNKKKVPKRKSNAFFEFSRRYLDQVNNSEFPQKDDEPSVFIKKAIHIIFNGKISNDKISDASNFVYRYYDYEKYAYPQLRLFLSLLLYIFGSLCIGIVLIQYVTFFII